MKEFYNTPILHLVDVATCFSAAVLIDSREMTLEAKKFKNALCNVHGPSAVLSVNLEFTREDF